MADLMSGPKAPLTKAFLFCGWKCITVDWLLDASHDLANPLRQASLAAQLKEVDFIGAAMDCSTKSRAREIPRTFDDGRPAPQPLRSVEFPEGLPDLKPSDQARVQVDNVACKFLLDQIQSLVERGGASVRENPWRSLHWYLPQEQAMMATGRWWDKRYASCCFMGARSKSQCLRHNLPEINDWPVLDCHHVHDPKEWEPSVVNGKRVYPSHEEAEYTAPLAFAIAVAASWWAVRMGRATLHVPRMPAISCHGRREHWLAIDPRAMREWAMAPLAVSLGLEPPDPFEAARVPKRGQVIDFLAEDKSIPSHCIYVGRGHHSHRLPLSKWSTPVTPGHDCTPEEWVVRYVDHICSSDTLWQALPELQGKTLVCDCPWQDLCEADLLAGLVFEATAPAPSPSTPTPRTRSPRKQTRHLMAAMAAARVVSVSSSPMPPQPFLQESIVLAFRKLYPEAWFQTHKFPMLEDLLNQPPFTCYLEWRAEAGMDWEGPLNPSMVGNQVRLALRMAEGKQAGALNQKTALPPLLPFGLDPDHHFTLAVDRASQPLPTEALPILDDDLRFAGSCSARWRGDLRAKRKQAIGALKELKARLASTTALLIQHQPDPIKQVTQGRDFALLSILILVMSWGDTSYPMGLITGLPAVGFAPHYNVFPRQPATPISQLEVLEDWESHNASILRSLKPGKDDQFLLSQSQADADRGFCTYPLKRADMLGLLKGQPHRLIPRCVITQSSGKQRIIDNADVGGQSLLSSDSNKLVLCSPLRPAQHIAVAHSYLSEEALTQAQASDAWESGGEDWPDAYRHSPMGRGEAMGCVVVWWHDEWAQPAYQLYSGLLFGLPLAVTSFNRYSRLVEAIGRRFLFLLVSLYFDDAHISDWQSSKGSGQAAFENLNALLGTPFAQEKRQTMSSAGLFLGLDHDVSAALSSGVVKFWARERLENKMMDLITTARQTGRLMPGTAAKLYGIANFFEQGIYGRVGCGGLAAIKERQYERGTSLTPAISASFEVLEAVVKSKPSRVFEVLPMTPPRFCVASDAALEAPFQGTGGFVIVWLSPGGQRREAFVANLPPQIYALWSPGEKKIAQLELIMVLYGLIARPDMFRGRRGVWFIDNTAALMSLIRGRSDSPDLEHMSRMIHVALYALNCWIFWEWIPSKSNWADAISRMGAADPWLRAQNFDIFPASFPHFIWSLPFRALVTLFELV